MLENGAPFEYLIND